MTGVAATAAATGAPSGWGEVAGVLARAKATGVVLRTGPDGGVTMHAPRPPGDDLLAGLRRHRDRIIALFVEEAEGAAPLNDPDHPDAVAAAQRAEAAGDFGPPAAPEEHDAALDGLLRGSAGHGGSPPWRTWRERQS